MTGRRHPHALSTSAMRLVIVTHVAHYVHDGRLFAYGPYAREIPLWARIFGQVVIAAPLHRRQPAADCLAIDEQNVVMAAQPETGGTTAAAKLAQLAVLPWSVLRLCVTLARADATLVRCPGNLGLLGALLAPLFSRRRIAKYAGQWSAYPGEPPTVRLQRVILSSSWWSAPVLVYGRLATDRPHVISFFTSILSNAQVAEATAVAARRGSGRGLRVLYVGRLSREKNVDVLLDAFARVRATDASLTIVGDGPAREMLAQRAAAFRIADRVTFTGALPFDDVLPHYASSDVVVLPSTTEGWPKTIAEGMVFGAVCIGPARGIVPEMLADGRGFCVPPRDVDAVATLLDRLAAAPDERMAIGRRASVWAARFTTERFALALREVIAREWVGTESAPLRETIHA